MVMAGVPGVSGSEDSSELWSSCSRGSSELGGSCSRGSSESGGSSEFGGSSTEGSELVELWVSSGGGTVESPSPLLSSV